MKNPAKRILPAAMGGLASLVSGCSGLSGENYGGGEIRYLPYREAIYKQASVIADNQDHSKAYQAARMFIKAGYLPEAEKIAERLVGSEKGRTYGLELYDYLQQYRDAHPEEKK